jgi:hypothetical protein
LRQIRVYYGTLHRNRQSVEEPAANNADSLGGIPFGRMDALEAVAIWDVNEDYKGSFSSLLLRPSLKLLQMRNSPYPDYLRVSPESVVDRIVNDVPVGQLGQVEALVLQRWRKEGFLEGLDKLLALFPNLKSLRVDTYSRSQCEGLGRLVRENVRHLSELVVDMYFLNSNEADFGPNCEAILRGLGSEWVRARPARGCRESTVHFKAEGRTRGEFSAYFFEDSFFQDWF